MLRFNEDIIMTVVELCDFPLTSSLTETCFFFFFLLFNIQDSLVRYWNQCRERLKMSCLSFVTGLLRLKSFNGTNRHNLRYHMHIESQDFA